MAERLTPDSKDSTDSLRAPIGAVLVLASALAGLSLTACGDTSQVSHEPSISTSTPTACVIPSLILRPDGSSIYEPAEENKYIQCLNSDAPSAPLPPSPLPSSTTEKNIGTKTPIVTAENKGQANGIILFKEGIPDLKNYLLSGPFRSKGIKDILTHITPTNTRFIIPSPLLDNSKFELSFFHEQNSGFYSFALVEKGGKLTDKSASYKMKVDLTNHTFSGLAQNFNPDELTNVFAFFYPYSDALCLALTNQYYHSFERMVVVVPSDQAFGNKTSPIKIFFETYGKDLGFEYVPNLGYDAYSKPYNFVK